MLHSFQFINGDITYNAKFVNNTEYLYYDPNSPIHTKNVSEYGANTHVTIRKVFNDVLLANDGSVMSNSFDANTLETIKHPYLFDGLSHFFC